MTAIQKAKDLTKLPLDELVGFVMTHETTVQEHMKEESKKKKRIAALKSITLEDDSDDEEALDEDDVMKVHVMKK